VAQGKRKRLAIAGKGQALSCIMEEFTKMTTEQIRNTSCLKRVKEELESTIADLEKLWALYLDDPESSDDNLGNMYEYGLAFDYVAPRTFKNQKQGYFRYQISWGGPSDEFRFYTDENLKPYKIEYWFMDWFDGAKKILSGTKFRLLAEIFDIFFEQSGAVKAEYDKAMEDYGSKGEE